MQNDIKELIKAKEIIKLLDYHLYKSLSLRNNDYLVFRDKIYDEIKQINLKVSELNCYYNRFKDQMVRAEKLKDIIEFIKDELQNQEVFVYGFFYNNYEQPLYIGQTTEGIKRIRDHLYGHSKAETRYPLHWIEKIKIWPSQEIIDSVKGLKKEKEELKNTNNSEISKKLNKFIRDFEKFMIFKLKPSFNDNVPDEYIRSDNDLKFQEALENEKEISILKFKERLKKFD
jgi:hypothetical protein